MTAIVQQVTRTAAHPDLPRLVGARMRELRQRAGYSQRHVALLMRTSREAVGAMERGERGLLALSTLKRFCLAVGAPIFEVLRVIDEADGWRFVGPEHEP